MFYFFLSIKLTIDIQIFQTGTVTCENVSNSLFPDLLNL